jgi:uncharacterized protein YukE
VAELLCANEKFKAENEKLKTENEPQKTGINALTEQLQGQAKQRYFSVQNFKNNETLFKFYTRLHDYETFKVLLDSFMPAAKNLVYYGSKSVQKD